MDKFYSLIVSFSGNEIEFELFSLKEYVEHENNIREMLLSTIVKPSQEIIDKVVSKIVECDN